MTRDFYARLSAGLIYLLFISTNVSATEANDEENLNLFTPQSISLQTVPTNVPEYFQGAVSPEGSKKIQGLSGETNVDLFSGSMGFQLPLDIPTGRLGVQPNLSLSYSSNSKNFGTIAGYGWSLPMSSVYRSTEGGSETLYTSDDFTAEIESSASELIVVDSTAGLYGSEIESDFTKWEFASNQWTATNTKGWTYTFGTTQSDPSDSTKVYKWLLDRVDEPNGNFMTYSYQFDQGQVYPDTIQYTGFGTDSGIYEIKFVLEDRPAYIDYRRSFKITNAKRVGSIEVYKYDTGSAELVYEYDLDYAPRNNAVNLLASVTQKKGSNSLPPVSFEYHDGTNKHIDLLSKITYPYGGTEEFTYKPSTAYRVGNNLANRVPFVIHTLYERKLQASSTDPVYTTTYAYQDGHYYYDNLDAYKKEYAGFNKVSITDPVGNVTENYFHQSELSVDDTVNGEFEDHIHKKGRLYREAVYDDQDNLYRLTLNQWDRDTLSDQDPAEDRSHVYLARTTVADYDGNSDYRAKSTTYEYDQYGNMDKEENWGEVTLNGNDGSFTDILDDKTKTTYEYAENTTDYLVAFPWRVKQFNKNNSLVGQTIYFYDALYGNGATQDALTKGNIYREKRLIEKSPNVFAVSKRAYFNNGLVKNESSPRNYKTHYTYDSHDLYPATVKNPKNQVTSYTYDYRSGQVVEAEDPNGAKTINTYDDFGRLIEVKVTDPNNTAQELTQQTVAYDLSSQPVSTTTTQYTQNNSVDLVSRTYLDGLGRTIQSRIETEGTNNFFVTKTTYDDRGNVDKQFVPITSNGGLSFEAINTAAVGTSFSYDPLGRQTQIQNPVGTTTIAYDQWEVQTTDAESNQKDLIYDAKGNLSGVREYLGTNTYLTTYEYSPLNYLTKITDAANNLKEMTYDFLGRKLSETDFYALGDGTYSTQYFDYDKNDNLISKTDGKGQITDWTYDELDRVVVEDFLGQAGTETSYTYDQGTNGIGRLSSVTSLGASKSFTYDILGRNTQLDHTIDGQTFGLSFSYDLLGNPLMVTYPDSTVVNYTYNSAGQLETTVTGNGGVVNNFDYHPTGNIARIDFANGVTTQNTYDINQMYRLTRKLTEDSSNNKLQDLNYTYDAANNVTQIVDSSDTNTAKTTNYGYDDLYRLISTTVTNSANSADYSRNYVYDIIGNITNRSDVGAYTYSGAGKISPHAVTDVAGTAYSYDDNGNLTSNGTWTHSWDYQDRLSTSTDGTDNIDYTYDEGRDRVLKNNTTTSKKTYYIDRYYDLEGTDGKAHIYAGDKKVATLKTDTTQ